MSIQRFSVNDQPTTPALGKVYLWFDTTANIFKYMTESGIALPIAGAGSVAGDSIWDAKGDLAAATGANAAIRLAVGTNGQVLTADSAEATGMKWSTSSGSGDVLGPASATDNAVVRFDATTGKLIQNSVVTIADSTGNMAGVGTLNTHTLPGGTGTLALTSQITGTNSGTNTGDQTTVSGNAGTATALQTARTINGTSFDGTANVTVTAAAGTLTGATLAAGVTASSLTSFGAAMILGTPASGVGTNLTGTAAGLTAGNVTTNANLTGALTSVGNATTLVSAMTCSIPLANPANQTIYADAKAAFGYTINSVGGAGTSSGTITLAVQINGVSVTGLSAVAITSTPGDSNASAANVVATGDIVTWVFSANSAANDLRFTMRLTRT